MLLLINWIKQLSYFPTNSLKHQSRNPEMSKYGVSKNGEISKGFQEASSFLSKMAFSSAQGITKWELEYVSS